MGRVRMPALASLTCAAALLTIPAHAPASPAGRAAIKQAVGATARAAGLSYAPLPLPERPRAAAMAASDRGLAQLARDGRPGRLLVGARTHEDLPAVEHAVARAG